MTFVWHAAESCKDPCTFGRWQNPFVVAIGLGGLAESATAWQHLVCRSTGMTFHWSLGLLLWKLFWILLLIKACWGYFPPLVKAVWSSGCFLFIHYYWLHKYMLLHKRTRGVKSKEKILSLIWFDLGCSLVWIWICGKLWQHYLQAWVLQLTAGREGLQTTVPVMFSVFSPLIFTQASPKTTLLEAGSSWKGGRNYCFTKREKSPKTVATFWERIRELNQWLESL